VSIAHIGQLRDRLLLPPEDQPNRGEIIEILDDEDSDILDKYIKENSTRQLCEETLPKIEEDQVDEETPEGK
jgi:hypothetical protein